MRKPSLLYLATLYLSVREPLSPGFCYREVWKTTIGIWEYGQKNGFPDFYPKGNKWTDYAPQEPMFSHGCFSSTLTWATRYAKTPRIRRIPMPEGDRRGHFLYDPDWTYVSSPVLEWLNAITIPEINLNKYI